jgi:hypothetical protein
MMSRDGSIVPRQNQPVAVISYPTPEGIFEREEPTLRLMEVGKQGDVSISFSNEMVYPTEWLESLSTGRRLSSMDGIQFSLQKPGRNQEVPLNPSNIVLTGLDPTKLSLKVAFSQPHLVSLSS